MPSNTAPHNPYKDPAVKLLLTAYTAMSRDAWEKGPTINEARDAINCYLDNLSHNVGGWREDKDALYVVTRLMK